MKFLRRSDQVWFNYNARNTLMKSNKIDKLIEEETRLIQAEYGMAALTNLRIYDEAAKRTVDCMTPLEIGKTLHPGCQDVALDEVPLKIIEDHRDRYTDEDLRQGQFVIVTGSHEHYIFIMGHETKRRKEKEKSL